MNTTGTEELQKQFKEETGYNWLNGDDEPDLDYVKWLEKKILSPSSLTTIEGEENWKAKYEKCIKVIKKIDVGIIGLYDL